MRFQSMMSKNTPSMLIMMSAEYFLFAKSLSVSAPGYLIYKYFVEMKRAINDIKRVSYS
jgi:hypothetical protein